MTTTRSESLSLAAVLAQVDRVRRALDKGDLAGASRAVDAIEEEARALRRQVAAGVHTNPPLVVFGNPPIGRGRARDLDSKGKVHAEYVNLMSVDVHEIRYTHHDDNKAYRHPFDGAVAMWATRSVEGRHTIYLVGLDGQPLWEDF